MEQVIATETVVEPIAAQETVVAAPEDAEARFAKLEEEKENYRKAYLKESSKNKEREESFEENETMEDVARRVLRESRLAEIAVEQDDIIRKTLKENKELKLAHLNKKEPIAAAGTHSEVIAVRDTLVTPEQMAYFKSKNWSDKDIERYKRNLGKRV